MKIGQFENKAEVSPALAERKAHGTPGNAGAAAGAEPSAKVQLSNIVSGLTDTSADGAFDVAKVERVSNAIRNGQFTVNPEAIADKLIANAQELLGTVTRR
jgi:negative regulator of flagellin synthesis FlgM